MTECTNLYETSLYPIQNGILKNIERLSFPFHLTDDTALNGVYPNHRYSDDIIFFIDDAPNFSDYTTTTISELTR